MSRFHLHRSGTVGLFALLGQYSSLAVAWNTYIYPLLSQLPSGSSDSRWRLRSGINALTKGLDGANLFVDSAAKEGDRLYFSAEKRPYTLKEILLKQVPPNSNVQVSSLLTLFNSSVLLGEAEGLNFDSNFNVSLVAGVASISGGFGVEDSGETLVSGGQVDTLRAGNLLRGEALSEDVYQLNRSLLSGSSNPFQGGVENCIVVSDFVSQSTGEDDAGKLVFATGTSIHNSFWPVTDNPGPSNPNQIPILNVFGQLSQEASVFTNSSDEATGSPTLVYRDPTGYLAASRMPAVEGDVEGEWGDFRVTGLRGIPIQETVPSNRQTLVYSSAEELWIPGDLLGQSARTGHVADADTVALWRMDDTLGSSVVTDSSGNARHAVRDAYLTKQCPGPFPGGKALEFGTMNAVYSPVVYEGDNSPFRLIGSMTFECWIYRHLWNANSSIFPYFQTIVNCISDDEGSESSADNSLYALVVGGGISGDSEGVYQYIHYWHEEGSGVDTPAGQEPFGVGSLDMQLVLYDWMHIAFRRTTAATSSVDIFLNGVKRSFGTGMTNPSGGGNARIKIGCAGYNKFYPTGTGNITPAFNGAIADVHISSVARSDDYILDDYKRGIGVLSS